MARIKDNYALSALGGLIKLLPTGTVFAFQFFSPVLSNNGQCHREHKYLMAALLTICGLNCAFATFTDSHTDEEGNTRYGVATVKGMWRPRRSSLKGDGYNVDLSEYRVRVKDFMHAILGLLIFGVVALLDPNTVDCYSLNNWEGNSREGMLKGLPIFVGVVCSVLFVVFPSKRNGIGYPSVARGYST